MHTIVLHRTKLFNNTSQKFLVIRHTGICLKSVGQARQDNAKDKVVDLTSFITNLQSLS